MSLLPDNLPAEAVELRRWSLDLVDLMVHAVEISFDELHPWMPWAAERPTRDGILTVIEESTASFDEDREWMFVVARPGRHEVLGSVGLHRRGEPDTLEIGYWIRSDVTGRGYATAAARALTTAAFHHVAGTGSVEIHMNAANRPSAAVASRLGYRCDREVDDPWDAPGRVGRLLIWVMDRADWEPTGSRPGLPG